MSGAKPNRAPREGGTGTAPTAADRLVEVLYAISVDPSSTLAVVEALRLHFPGARSSINALEMALCGEPGERRRGHPAIDDRAALVRIAEAVNAGTPRATAIASEARRLASLEGRSVESISHRLRDKLKKHGDKSFLTPP
jgi:hypothetical protein